MSHLGKVSTKMIMIKSEIKCSIKKDRNSKGSAEKSRKGTLSDCNDQKRKINSGPKWTHQLPLADLNRVYPNVRWKWYEIPDVSRLLPLPQWFKATPSCWSPLIVSVYLVIWLLFFLVTGQFKQLWFCFGDSQFWSLRVYLPESDIRTG